MSIGFLCPVRGCQQPLPHEGSARVCPRGHSFDVARSGYINLCQPQDKKSKNPGDSVEAVKARRRLNDAGLEKTLAGVLVQTVLENVKEPAPAVLDVGCGEGFHLSSLLAGIGGEGVGVDLSPTAIELAAKRYPAIAWMVANGDRQMPFAAGTFDLILSITARHHAVEYRRLLNESGHLLVVIPGSDDLIELREAVMGQGSERERAEAIVAIYQPYFELRSRRTWKERHSLGRAALLDLLASTYRGGRKSQVGKIAVLSDLEVTSSREILMFTRTRVSGVGQER